MLMFALSDEPLHRHVGDAELEAVRLRPPEELREPSSTKVSPMVAMNSVICGWFTSGRSTRRSIAIPSTTITAQRDRDRDPEIHAALDQRHEGQRGEEHHRALREVEDAGGLVDQHEAERHQRIHDAGEQAADQDFEEELPVHARLRTAARPAARRAPSAPSGAGERSELRGRLISVGAEVGADDDRVRLHLAGRSLGDLARRGPSRRRSARCPSPRPCRARSG